MGIIGDNGCGKSTLLNIMTGRLKPDSGEVEIGETVKIGVFAQENVDMDEKQRVIDYIRDEAEIIRTADGHITASRCLTAFFSHLLCREARFLCFRVGKEEGCTFAAC